MRNLLLAVTIAASIAAPAAAAVKIATYSGTVNSGVDETGVFFAPGTDLTGFSWAATFTYDRGLGSGLFTDGVSYDISSGGPEFGGGGSPILAASITISGVTRSLTGQSGYVRTQNYPYVRHYAGDVSDDGITFVRRAIGLEAYPLGAPTSLDQNFGPATVVGAVFGQMTWQTYIYATDSNVELATATFGYDGVYSVRDAVPEPASWAMLIAGFGLTGAAMRRRRTSVAAA